MQAQLKEEEDRQEREYSAARSNQYDSEGVVRYRPEDFHFLKVLGKGSFGKVSRFIVLSMYLNHFIKTSQIITVYVKFRFASVWNVVVDALKDQLHVYIVNDFVSSRLLARV